MQNKKRYYILIVLVLLVLLGVGYAFLSSTLTITGNSEIAKNTWNIHFENISITDESVIAKTPATITNNSTQLDFAVDLNAPGEYYEFTVDVVNSGSIDAMVSEVLLGGITTEQAVYAAYIISYADGEEINEKDFLGAGERTTLKMSIKYRDDITSAQLPTVEQTLNLSFKVTYIQADETADITSISFAADSWDTIARNVRRENISNYNLGDTKEIDLGSLGKHTIRIANTTTPAECQTEDYSQSACGFVVEFEDIITTYNMNSTSTNVGGWPASEMRDYIEKKIYPSLPTELQNRIIDTTVVSSYGSSDTSNFVSTDKLYLLSTIEIWGVYGTTADKTRQLDYYKSISATPHNDRAVKKNGNASANWYSRTANSNKFFTIAYTGSSGLGSVEYCGVSPAFRLG